MVFAVWTSKAGPFNQMIYVLIAVGGILSPLVSKPFLRDGKDNSITWFGS